MKVFLLALCFALPAFTSDAHADPPNIPALQFWLDGTDFDADGNANNPGVGQPIPLWKDKVDGLELVNDGSGAEAQPVVGLLNGVPSAVFSGNHLLQRVGVINFLSSDTTGTMAMVYTNSNAVEGYGFVASTGTGNLIGSVILNGGYPRPELNGGFGIQSIGLTPNNNLQDGWPPVNDGAYHWSSISSDGSRWKFSTDGVTSTVVGDRVGDNTGDWFGSFASYNLITLGGYPDTGGGINSSPYEGNIAEVLIYDHELSGADQTLLGDYIAGKYGAPPAVPPVPPGIIPGGVDTTFNGGGDGSRWDSDDNWSDDAPTGGSGSRAFINDNHTVLIDGSTAATTGRLLLADGAGSDVATLNVTGGTLNVGFDDARIEIGSVGDGTLRVTGGVVNTTRIRTGVDAVPTARGTLEIDGGEVNVVQEAPGNGWIIMGVGRNAAATGVTQRLNMISGSLTAHVLIMADEQNSTAIANMTGGTIDVDILGLPTNAGVPAPTSAHFQLDGGTLTVHDPSPPISQQGTGGLPSGMRIIDDPNYQGSMDITGGTLLLAGDATAAVEEYIAQGVLTGFGDPAKVVFDVDESNPGFTTVTAIPEPTTLALLAFGLVGLGTLRRRGRRIR